MSLALLFARDVLPFLVALLIVTTSYLVIRAAVDHVLQVMDRRRGHGLSVLTPLNTSRARRAQIRRRAGGRR